MRVKIITDRQPWAGGTSHDKDSTPDLDAGEAQLLIEAGFAEAMPEDDTPPAPRRRVRADTAEV